MTSRSSRVGSGSTLPGFGQRNIVALCNKCSGSDASGLEVKDRNKKSTRDWERGILFFSNPEACCSTSIAFGLAPTPQEFKQCRWKTLSNYLVLFFSLDGVSWLKGDQT